MSKNLPDLLAAVEHASDIHEAARELTAFGRDYPGDLDGFYLALDALSRAAVRLRTRDAQRLERAQHSVGSSWELIGTTA